MALAGKVQEDYYVLEVVGVRSDDGSLAPVVLKRGDVYAAFGDETMAEDWNSVIVDREALVASLMGGFGNRRDLAEEHVANWTVSKPYSLAELGVSSAQELLSKYFSQQRSEGDPWWIYSDKSARLSRPDLAATLKMQGFEVVQGDYVPWIAVVGEEDGGD